MKVTATKFNLLTAVRQLTREKWALGATVFTGKMIGLGLVVLAIFTIPGFFWNICACSCRRCCQGRYLCAGTFDH